MAYDIMKNCDPNIYSPTKRTLATHEVEHDARSTTPKPRLAQIPNLGKCGSSSFMHLQDITSNLTS